MIDSGDYLVKTDKNGTKYWANDVCPKCNGRGHIPYYNYIENGVCFKCNGSGHFHHEWKEYTPEYAEILEEKRIKMLEKKAKKNREDWLSKNAFNSEGFTWVVKGNTFSIKDSLKELGAKYHPLITWHFDHEVENSEKFHYSYFFENDFSPTGFTTSCNFDSSDLKLKLTSDLPVETPVSQFLGTIGKRESFEVVLKNVFEFMNEWGYSYIYKFEDENENVIIWKTGTYIVAGKSTNEGNYPVWLGEEKVLNFTLKGTVKEHTTYRNENQTILTRCKVL
jgi:hypothetical protein